MTEHSPLPIDLSVQLVGDRVVVRPWRESDALALLDLVARSRAHLERWLPWTARFQSAEDTRAYVRAKTSDWLSGRDFDVGVFDTTGDPLGGACLHPVSLEVPSFSIGYWIGAPFEGRGYATEAVQLVVAFAFDSLGARRLLITCDADNRRSADLALRCGFTLERVVQSDGPRRGRPHGDTLLFALVPGGGP